MGAGATVLEVGVRVPVKRYIERLALLGFGLACGLLGGEAALRAYALLDEEYRRESGFHPDDVVVEAHGDFGYRQKPNRRFRYANQTYATSNSQGFRGPEIVVPKPTGTFRIVLLGGSTTHGWGVNDNETVDTAMRRLFREGNSGSNVEVVNLAFDGYDSYQLYERLRTDGIRLDPDLVIVNSGINDVRNARFPDLQDRDSRTLLWQSVIMRARADRIRGRPTIWHTIKQHSYLAQTPAFVRQRWSSARGLAEPGEIIAHDGALAYFERNLLRIAELLAERGTPIIFSTPPSALPMNFEPTDTLTSSYWLNNAATTQEYRDSLAGRMETVVEKLRRRGQPVSYIRPVLAPELFLDDCHLTPEGSRSMAVQLAEAANQYLRSARATWTASGN